MKTKIYVMTHRKFVSPKDPVYIPLHVGRAVSEELGYLGDDTGENISDKNEYFGELTGLFWVAHQETEADYLGLCHYRRYFVNEKGHFLSAPECEEMLGKTDIILPRAVYYSKPYYKVYEEAHNLHDLNVTGEVIKELYPDDYEIFQEVIEGNKVYNCNMFITSTELCKEYATWLFSIFDVVAKRINVEDYDVYHKRVFGFLSEQLLYVWVKKRGLQVAECPVALTQEKAETIDLKQRLNQKLVRGNKDSVEEALDLFRREMKERPDLLLPASDLFGELADMFRVLYVCQQELQNLDRSVLELTDDLELLVTHYRFLEKILLNVVKGVASADELRYYQESAVSEYMLMMLVNNNPTLRECHDIL